MHPQEFGAAHTLHSSTIDGQWWVFSVAFPEVNHNLLCFADIQQEVVVSAPRGQKVDLLPVVGLIVLGDETHQSCVVRKLHHVIGAVGCCAVVSQQGVEQGTEHTALRGPCAECDAARDVVADSYCLGSLTEKVQHPIAKGGVEPQLVQFTDELLWDYCIKS